MDISLAEETNGVLLTRPTLEKFVHAVLVMSVLTIGLLMFNNHRHFLTHEWITFIFSDKHPLRVTLPALFILDIVLQKLAFGLPFRYLGGGLMLPEILIRKPKSLSDLHTPILAFLSVSSTTLIAYLAPIEMYLEFSAIYFK